MLEKSECLTAEQRAAIVAELTANEQQLIESGKIAPADERSVVSFDWPLRAAPALDWNGYAILVNYVDQQLGQGNGLLDYQCNSRTYDGHYGTDITLWPFPWYLKNNDLVEVVAAEAGDIIGKFDGNFDEQCSWGPNQYWNAVYIRHSDGSVAWYGHMKQSSLTSKPIGASVSKGEYLGIVASSGFSSGPHLHFEVYRQQPYQNSNLIDPYAGVCNSTNNESWWASQQPYWKPTLNALLTHNAVPVHGCPTPNEMPHFSDYFPEGARVYTILYFRDEQQGQVTNLRLRMPNGALAYSWAHTAPATYSSSWWWWYWDLPAGAPLGIWQFEATFGGQTFVHEFQYGNTVSTHTNNEISGISLSPNPTAGHFVLRSNEGGNVFLQIFDSVGRLRYSGQESLNEEIGHASLLEPGVYFIKAYHDDAVQLFKLVKE